MRNVKTVIAPPWMLDALSSDMVVGPGIPMRSRIGSVQEAYARVPLFFRGVRIRCNSLLNIPRHIYKLGKGGAREEVAWPFPVDLPWLLWRIQAAVLMAGGSPVVKVTNPARRSVGGPPQDLQWLNPFTVIVKWDGKLGKRIYTQAGQFLAGGSTREWTDDEIIFVREYSPIDDIGFGTSAASVAMQSARVAFAIPQMAAQFFENGAMPITTLSVAEGTDELEVKRLESFFQRAMRGVANAFRVIGVKGNVSLQSTQSRMKDLAVPDLKDDARKDIARALEMPVTLLDSDETFATAQTHQRSYYMDTVAPAAAMIATALNRDCLNAAGLVLEFALQEMSIFQEDEAERAGAYTAYVNAGMPPKVAATVLGVSIPEDVQAEWDAMIDLAQMRVLTEAAARNLLTRDEWRTMQRIPKIDNVPVFVGVTVRLTDTNAPVNSVTGEQVQDVSDQIAAQPDIPPAIPQLPPGTGDPDEQQLEERAKQNANNKTVERGQFLKVARKSAKRAAAFHFKHLDASEIAGLYIAVKVTPAYGSDGHRAMLKKADDRLAPYEAKVKRAVTGLFEKQRDAIVKRVKGEQKAAPAIGSPKDWHAEFEAALKKLLEDLIPAVGVQALDDLSVGLDFDLSDARVTQFIQDAAQRFAQEVNDTTWEQLKASLSAGVDAGESIDDLAARVEQVMGDRIQSSAETIARTEVLPAYNYATREAWAQSGVVATRTWLATLDDRVRDAHAEAHGQTVALDEPYDVGGEQLMYPGDPDGSAENIINCRCTEIANLKE